MSARPSSSFELRNSLKKSQVTVKLRTKPTPTPTELFQAELGSGAAQDGPRPLRSGFVCTENCEMLRAATAFAECQLRAQAATRPFSRCRPGGIGLAPSRLSFMASDASGQRVEPRQGGIGRARADGMALWFAGSHSRAASSEPSRISTCICICTLQPTRKSGCAMPCCLRARTKDPFPSAPQVAEYPSSFIFPWSWPAKASGATESHNPGRQLRSASRASR